MTDKPINLDGRRGMAAQKATSLRRTLATAEAVATRLRERQMKIEARLLNKPAATWPEAAAKARYVLNLYFSTLGPRDQHHRELISSVLQDFSRLDNEN